MAEARLRPRRSVGGAPVRTFLPVGGGRGESERSAASGAASPARSDRRLHDSPNPRHPEDKAVAEHGVGMGSPKSTTSIALRAEWLARVLH